MRTIRLSPNRTPLPSLIPPQGQTLFMALLECGVKLSFLDVSDNRMRALAAEALAKFLAGGGEKLLHR